MSYSGTIAGEPTPALKEDHENMRFITLTNIAVAALAAAVITSGAAATMALPTATAVLFDAPHLSNVEKGSALKYRFQRTVSNPTLQGEPFSDDIEVDVVDGQEGAAREVIVKVFTGDRGRPPQRINGMTGNPLLVVFLDRAVNNFLQLAGGSRPYVKQKMKLSLAQTAKIEPAKITFNGKAVDGYRIKVTPFVGDPNALKMMGYDGTSLELVVSDKVPGHLVSLSSLFASPMKDSPRLEERITLDGVEGVQ